MEKWTLTAHLKASVHSNFRNLCEVSSQQENKHLSQKSIVDSEASVQKVYKTILEHFNPFSISSCDKVPLKNICSGHVVKMEYRDEVLNARKIGKEATEKFVRDRIVEQSIPFLETIKKLNLHTFAAENKKLKISRKSEPLIILKDHQRLFSKLLTVSTSRQIDLKDVLSHELSALPLSLFHPTGEMRKTNKSQLLKELENMTTSTETLVNENKEKSATIIDFMALVQSLNKSGLQTFDQLTARLESSILSNRKESNILVLVPDRYDLQDSIKSDERARRQTSEEVPVVDIVNGSLKLPKDLATYLSSSKNKTNLINYTYTKWESTMQEKLLPNQSIYLARLDGSTVRVTREETNTTELVSDHEEADSKMFVYCQYLTREYDLNQIVIHSPDTDVAVICCYQYATTLLSLQNFWFKTGVGKNIRYIAIHDITSSLGPNVCKLLPAFHSITGCDSVSSFSGVGKKSAFIILRKNVHEFKDLEMFGDSPVLSLEDDSVVACIRFVCLLYNKSPDVYDINHLRYKLFTQRSMSGEKLPPTLDALTLHLRRANYQCYIWKSSCVPLLSLPSPDGNGWIKSENGLQHDRMTKKAVPDAIAELARCTCKKGCKTNLCCCRKASLVCTDACQCQDGEECQNSETLENSSDDEDDY